MPNTTRRRLTNVKITEDTFQLIQRIPKGMRGRFFHKVITEMTVEAVSRGNKAIGAYTFGNGTLKEFLGA